MTQNENRDDLHEYGRRGRGIGLSIMLALLAVLVLAGCSGLARMVRTR